MLYLIIANKILDVFISGGPIDSFELTPKENKIFLISVLVLTLFLILFIYFSEDIFQKTEVYKGKLKPLLMKFREVDYKLFIFILILIFSLIMLYRSI
jgi:hypothetical protein